MSEGRLSVTVPNSDQILTVQGYGADAYRAGKTARLNPYSWGTEREFCQAWIRGFNMARTERARAITANR